MESDMIRRASRQAIARFVMCGSEALRFDDGNFDERLRKSEDSISEFLSKLELPSKQVDELTDREGSLLDLYFEEGVKIGALLSRELTQ